MPLGWLWLIPAFHLPEPPAADPSSSSTSKRTHTLVFPRSQIDFAIGPGTSVHSVIVRLEDVMEMENQAVAPLLSEEQERQVGLDDSKGENVKEDGER